MRRVLLLCMGILWAMAVFWGLAGLSSDAVVTSLTEQRQETALSFPFPISHTDCEAVRLLAYEGDYLEDGSLTYVSGVAALEVVNRGTSMVAELQITLQGTEGVYVFHATCLPPGDSVIVLESRAAAFRLQNFLHCTGLETGQEITWLAQPSIRARTQDMGTILLENTTNEILSGLTLYYKNYLPESGVLVGGISRTLPLPSLVPGKPVAVKPPFYAAGYSKIVGIKISQLPGSWDRFL